MYVIEGCTSGFAQDLWVDVGERNASCTLPIGALTVFCDIWSALLALLVPFLIHLSLIMRRKNRRVMMIAVTCVIDAGFMIAFLQTHGEKTNYSFLLCSLFIVSHMCSSVFATNDLCVTIPNTLADQIILEHNIVSKDGMIRLNFAISIISILVLFIAFVVFVPFYLSRGDNEMAEVFFRVGSAANAVIALTLASIGFRSISILKSMVDSVIKTGDKRAGTLKQTSKKLGVGKIHAGVALFIFPVIFILHVIFLPLYWYLAVFYIVGCSAFFPAMLNLYYLEYIIPRRVVSTVKTSGLSMKIGLV